MAIASGAAGDVKAYSGGTFTPRPVLVYDGSKWSRRQVRFWNGSAWVLS